MLETVFYFTPSGKSKLFIDTCICKSLLLKVICLLYGYFAISAQAAKKHIGSARYKQISNEQAVLMDYKVLQSLKKSTQAAINKQLGPIWPAGCQFYMPVSVKLFLSLCTLLSPFIKLALINIPPFSPHVDPLSSSL
jgi:hypothetical protein